MAQSYYDNAVNQYSNSLSIEIATLQGDIVLPKFAKEKLTLKYLTSLSGGGGGTSTTTTAPLATTGAKVPTAGGYVAYTDKNGATGSFSASDYNTLLNVYGGNTEIMGHHTYGELTQIAQIYGGSGGSTAATGGSGGSGGTAAMATGEEDAADVYKQPWSSYTNVVGNFYIQTLFPLVENGESTEMEHDAPTTKAVINGGIKSSKYVERNYVSLMIPRYIALNFLGIIPKGTKCLVAMIGGSASLNNLSIIGIYGASLSATAVDLSKKDGGIGGGGKTTK